MLVVDADCRGSPVTVSTDTGLALDIVQVSTSDSSIQSSAKKTNSKISSYLFFALATAVTLALEQLVLIASAAAVTFAALHW